MQNFIRKPSVDLYPGIRVDKETTFHYKTDKVDQKLVDLMFHSVTKVEGDGYRSVYTTTIELKEGDVLLFEEDGRGYIKPVEGFVAIEEAIEDLTCIKDLGEDHVQD